MNQIYFFLLCHKTLKKYHIVKKVKKSKIHFYTFAKNRSSMIKIGITGHINLKAECIPYYRDALLRMIKELKDKYTKVVLYSALADGADRLIVEVAMKLDIEYIAVLPMPKVDYCTDFTEASSIQFEYLLENALSVIEIPLLSLRANKRDLQYEASGIFISDKCDILIALWDGNYTNLKGGTSEIVKYHLSKKYYNLSHLLVSRESDLTNNMIEFKHYEKR